MKIGEAERWLREQLTPHYGEGEGSSMASIAMDFITGLYVAERRAVKDGALSERQLQRFNDVSDRLLRQEPVQYVIKRCWFYGREFFVDNSVLIPRSETEELVDWVLKDVKSTHPSVFEKNETDADDTTSLKILDVGTGSGCIALSLKNKMPKAEVWGCDVSEEALNVARRNGSELNVRVDFQGIDFLDEAQQKLLPTVNIIVSNPPYIPKRDAAQMHPNVLEHEPHLALFVPDEDALVFYKALAHFGHKRLYENGAIYVEIHEDLAQSVQQLFSEAGYHSIELRKDMQGKDRMVKAAR